MQTLYENAVVAGPGGFLFLLHFSFVFSYMLVFVFTLNFRTYEKMKFLYKSAHLL